MPLTVPVSLLDLAVVTEGRAVSGALQDSVAFAQAAERLGYTRVWYAEHHNIATIASSAPAVLIAHIAAKTETIRLGSGGVMLPNHAPLIIAEQYGTLAELYPGRIDLGLGRAPGTDGRTMQALRRDATSADTFPQDVLELQGYLGDESTIPGIRAQPGRGTHVPLYILGSSLFGAQLAAALGLPYAFASHFAPAALDQAAAVYREQFKPSEQQQQPHFIAALNVLAADDEDEAQRQFKARRRMLAKSLFTRPDRALTEQELDMVLASDQALMLDQMMQYTALGTTDAVAAYLETFQQQTQADELMTVHQADSLEGRIRSLELVSAIAGCASVT